MNIMLNDYCNLKCSYCFAHMCEERTDISDENMNEYVDFLKRSNHRSLRILGGEPTLHPSFSRYVQTAISDPFFQEILIFTNGSMLNRDMIEKIASEKTAFLINFNHPKDIGEHMFETIKLNVQNLVSYYRRKKYPIKISLGINIYDKDFDFNYIVDFTKQLGLEGIRYSIVVPAETGKEISIDYYRQFIPRIMEFLKVCYDNNIRTNIDCNPIPKCLFSKDQIIDMLAMRHDMCTFNNCNMPLDVRPDLNATRCFPFYDDYHINIKNYDNVYQIIEYFAKEIDSKRYIVPTFKECKDCKFFVEKKCQGSCMTYKFIK